MNLRLRLQQLDAADAIETAEYLDVDGEQLYCVSHGAVGRRRGGVLLLPPFGRERMDAYTSLVTWARRLAASGFDVLRFDYRGTGESTGLFAAADVGQWLADAAAAMAHLQRRLAGAPLVLHGVRFGGLLAAQQFAAGAGDALLLWEPPKHARDALFEALRAKLLEDMALGIPGARKTRDAYLADLQQDRLVEVDGQPWSRRLWNSAEGLGLQLPAAAERRPWRLVQLVKPGKPRAVAGDGAWQVPVPSPPFWREHPDLVPDLGDLFAVTVAWLQAQFGPGDGGGG